MRYSQIRKFRQIIRVRFEQIILHLSPGHNLYNMIDYIIRELATVRVTGCTRVIVGQNIGQPLQCKGGSLRLSVTKRLEHSHILRKETFTLLRWWGSVGICSLPKNIGPRASHLVDRY